MAEQSRADTLLAGCRQLLGEEPVARPVERLLAYLDLLDRWNRAYNLTAVRDREDMIPRHLFDSLAVLPWLETASLLDAGSGAGLPGIPLAIMRPEMQVTLLDSAGKKIRFLRHVKRELGLDNVVPVHDRLETFAPDPPPSVIISRAFSTLDRFAAAAQHLLAPGARLFAMKGRYPADEIDRLPSWIRLDRVEKLFPPGLHEQRHLVMMSLPE